MGPEVKADNQWILMEFLLKEYPGFNTVEAIQSPPLGF
jgi:hypothetical protein